MVTCKISDVIFDKVLFFLGGNIMSETYLVYCDETGDDGNNTKSSNVFILTTITMNSNDWHYNYEKIRNLKKSLKNQYGLHIKEETYKTFCL